MHPDMDNYETWIRFYELIQVGFKSFHIDMTKHLCKYFITVWMKSLAQLSMKH